MPIAPTEAYYDREAARLAQVYEGLAPQTIHAAFLPHLPAKPGLALDIGAGSGRDAAWLAGMGHSVVAVEPSAGFIAEGEKRHGDKPIHWLRDGLPALESLRGQEGRFDTVLLSAVWMHLPPEQRPEAMARLKELLAPGGRILISLRHGKPDPERAMFSVSEEEVVALAGSAHAPTRVSDPAVTDLQGRGDVWWSYMTVTDLRSPAPEAAPAAPRRRAPQPG